MDMTAICIFAICLTNLICALIQVKINRMQDDKIDKVQREQLRDYLNLSRQIVDVRKAVKEEINGLREANDNVR